MKTYIYRNSTIENLFPHINAEYSGYGDIVPPTETFERFFWFYTLPFRVNTDDLVTEINGYTEKLQFILSNNYSLLYCFTLQQSVPHIQWVNDNNSLQIAISKYNARLYELSKNKPNIKVIDIQEFCSEYKVSELFDWRFFYMSETAITPRVAKQFSQWFEKKQKAIEQKRKKCLVLDLDNTMWGGVLGEDGIEGIKLGDTYSGNVFLDFQKCVVEASKNGVILTVCSKNNEQDVLDAWKQHPFMQIGTDTISAYRINWNDKVSNIIELAEELNIGLDSFVFIDDNPVERERVKQFLPEVAVPDFPQNTYELINFFKNIYEDYFQTYTLTDEDIQKNKQYAENFKRKQHQQSFVDIEAYYKSLDMQLLVYKNNPIFITRLAQMTQKTNQFNLTTKRYTESDIQEFMHNDSVFALEVKDKFGNNGITAMAIICCEDSKIAVLDSFLLSCRVLGRDIETVFLLYICNVLFERGFTKLKASFIPTKKNTKLAKDFLDKSGFDLVNCSENGEKYYILKLKELKEIKEYYNFKEV